jgi:hypothetical protein
MLVATGFVTLAVRQTIAQPVFCTRMTPQLVTNSQSNFNGIKRDGAAD